MAYQLLISISTAGWLRETPLLYFLYDAFPRPSAQHQANSCWNIYFKVQTTIFTFGFCLPTPISLKKMLSTLQNAIFPSS